MSAVMGQVPRWSRGTDKTGDEPERQILLDLCREAVELDGIQKAAPNADFAAILRATQQIGGRALAQLGVTPVSEAARTEQTRCVDQRYRAIGTRQSAPGR